MDDLHFITDRQIYEQVIQEAVPSATEFLWLATSDLKDLHVQAIMAQFDRVWMGAECQACQRKAHCADYPELLARTPAGT